MGSRSRHTDSFEELNIWPAFTDLMSNAFMILIMLLSLALVKSLISSASDKTSKGVPPILVIEDKGAYRFASGSAEIPNTMSTYIWKKIVPEIERKTKEYQINVVEVIGHTDGQANGTVTSNLDINLEKV